VDKGIAIDARVNVSLVGIELLWVRARVVIASVETYLKSVEVIGLAAKAATTARAGDQTSPSAARSSDAKPRAGPHFRELLQEEAP
jgi:hypothetical protein